MIAKQIIRSLLLVVALGSVLIWAGREFRKSQAVAEATQQPAPTEQIPAVDGSQVVMTYFLLGKRCASCRKIEAFTRATAEKDFADELADHRLVFRVINTDEPAYRHFLKDYQLTSKTVILSHRLNGSETEWMDMEKVWDLLDDEAAFRTYLGTQIRSYLGS
jgi:hypothetical protein